MKTIFWVALISAIAIIFYIENRVSKSAPDDKRWPGWSAAENKNLSECEKAGGKIIKIAECDMSESEWCVISKKEQCYADQVSGGRCTEGEYSEEQKAIIGISPRVTCNEDKWQGR